ncbi:MAG TPA: hypothetical protein VL383_12520 [Gemmatimonadaceae bacterium]|jgi:hypothetical protein|nr:hypothetical protein [Gemmatimonadaceae bacterium]
MEKQPSRIRIELTDDQRSQIKQVSGEDVPSLEFTVEELEGRIAPTSLSFGTIKWTYTPQ